MLKELITEIILEELRKELGIQLKHAINSKHNTAINSTGALFFSLEEQTIVDLLESKGPLKQTGIISALANDMNGNTIKELLANLVRRRVLLRGSNGYEVIVREYAGIG